MYNQNAFGTARLNNAGNRTYRIEVTGMRQNAETDRRGYSIRQSGRWSLIVPYNRLSDQMQRIARMGGQIVSVRPANVGA